MSGPGNGEEGGFGGGGGIPSVDCDEVSIKTSITSPDPSVLSLVKKGDLLDVELQTPTGPLVAITNTRQTLGSIFTTNPQLLINCIGMGFEYQAKVLNIDGADCEILITVK